MTFGLMLLLLISEDRSWGRAFTLLGKEAMPVSRGGNLLIAGFTPLSNIALRGGEYDMRRRFLGEVFDSWVRLQNSEKRIN